MTLKEKIERIKNFSGSIAAALTPFTEHGETNPNMIGNYVRYLADRVRVNGIFVHGSAGEGPNMTNDEKLMMIRKWMEMTRERPDFLKIFCVSSTCVKEVIAQAKLCQELGADAIAVLPPFYYRPEKCEDLVKYMKVISRAAPKIPLLYYHIPSMTKVDLDFMRFVRIGLESIPAFCGMKYTSEDMIVVQDVQRVYGDRFKIFMGFEQTLLPGVVFGINAGICCLFNVRWCVTAFEVMVNQLKTDFDHVAVQQHFLLQEIKTLTKDEHIFCALRKQVFEDSNEDVALGSPQAPIVLPALD